MGEKGDGDKEYTCDEHWVICGIAELLYCTPEANITLYVNYTEHTHTHTHRHTHTHTHTHTNKYHLIYFKK